MPSIKGFGPSRRLPSAACALTLSLAIGACTPAGRDAESLTRVQSALGAVVAPIAVGSDTEVRIYALSNGGQFGRFGEGHNPHAIAMGDVNGDGLDEVIVGGPGSFRIFSQFGQETSLSIPSFSFVSPNDVVASGDIDGDGRDEIVVGTHTGSNGAGDVAVFSTDPAFQSAGLASLGVNFPSGGAIAVCDLDGDGSAEIVVAPSFQIFHIAVVANTTNSNKQFEAEATLPNFFAAGKPTFKLGQDRLACGDLNGDSFDDLIVTNAGSNAYQIFTNPSRPPVTFFPATGAPTFLQGFAITAGDLDGDGLAEVAIGGVQNPVSGGTVTVYSGPGKTAPAVFQGSTSTTVSVDSAFAIGRHPTNFASDQDGDSIPDSWETAGVDINGDGCVDYDLKALGADPLHKDLFVEVDSMSCSVPGGDCAAGDTHDHTTDLSPNGLGPVVDAFGLAPLANPDGKDGILLHIQIDERVAHQNAISLDGSRTVENAFFGTAAERAQTASFTTNGHSPCTTTPALVLAAKGEVFRYALYGHKLVDGSAAGFIGVTPGDATGPQQRFLLGLFEDNLKPNSDPLVMQATFMHEFGHSLGLQHGGNNRFNWKPNYLSIMNYRFNTGLSLKAGGRRLDFSRIALSDLFEIDGPPFCFDPTNPNSCVPDDLFEFPGIGSVDTSLDTAYLCPGGALTWVPAASTIDWNCNMKLTTGIKTYPNPAVVLPPDPDSEITVISDVNGDRFCVAPNPTTGVLSTPPNLLGGVFPSGGDDFVMGGYIAAGINGVLESATKSAGLQLDDVLVAVPPPPPPDLVIDGIRSPRGVIVAGPNKQIDTLIPSGVDDAIVLYHIDPGPNGKIDVAVSIDDVVYNDATSLGIGLRSIYGSDVINELIRDVQFPLLDVGGFGRIDSSLGDDVLVPVMIGPGSNGVIESATVSNGLQGDDAVDPSGTVLLPGPDGFLQTAPVADEIVQGLYIVDGPNRTCESSPVASTGDVQADEDGNGSTFRVPGSVQHGQLTGFDDWHNLQFKFRGAADLASHITEQTPEQLRAQLRQSAFSDVTVAVSPSKATIAADAPVTYHVTVTNQGPSFATSVRVAIALPAGMILDGCQPGAGSGGARAGVAAIFPSIAASAAVTADFTAHTGCTQAAGSTVTAVFTATSESVDLNPADNVASVSSTVAATKPSFTFVPPPIATSSCVGVALGKAVAADACSAIASIVNDAPAHFALGRTIVTWRATTAGGAVATATQAVTAVLADDDSCCPVGSHKIIGTSNNDVLTGTSGADCILGRGGQDHIVGGGGDDAISGGDGDDFIDGQDGNDRLYGGPGQDTINGSAGNDFIDGGPGDDICSGGVGDDTIFGGQGQDHLSGDAGNDHLYGEQGTDVLAGGDGNDDLEGGQAGTTAGTTDQCTGGTGANVFVSCPSRPDAPAAVDACHDGALDGGETGVDCGGASCFPCAGGVGCQTSGDCQSGICGGGVCAAAKTPLWAAIVVTSDWGAGYCVTIFATNLGTAPTVGWSVRIDTNQSVITSSWVGAFDGTQGSVQVTTPAGQGAIAAGATNGAIGFCANRLTSASTFPLVLNQGASF